MGQQPEMQPEGPPQDGRSEGAAGLRPGDLAGRTFPLGDWGEPAERLDELYRWVERGALETAAWYLADRVWKRRGARGLRTGAAAGAVCAAALPLLDLARVLGGAAAWGYLALLFAVACVAVDRFFGVTSGWIRDVATAQAVQRRPRCSSSTGPRRASGRCWARRRVRRARPRSGVLRCCAGSRRTSRSWCVRRRRTGWSSSGPVAPMGIQGAVASGGRADVGGGYGRFPMPPGANARPNMPRQRPPEPR